MGGMTPLLEARNLAIGHGGTALVSDIALELARGEVLCLLGPNGAGKTTLFRTLLGLIPPVCGEVRLDGAALVALSRAEIAARVAHVPQALPTVFAYRAIDIVLMGAAARLGPFSRPGPREEERAFSALESVGIAMLAEADITTLSGGQRQLVAIARAIAQDAAAIVMDEPTASLDFANRIHIGNAIRSLAQRGIGIVLSTHDPDQAAELGNRALLLAHGAVIASGSVADVMTADNLTRLYGIPIQRDIGPNGRARFSSP